MSLKSDKSPSEPGPTLKVSQKPDSTWLEQNLAQLLAVIEPAYFISKRWFGSKTRQLKSYRPLDFCLVSGEPVLMALVIIQLDYAAGEPEVYHLPLALGSADDLPAQLRDQPHAVAVTLETPEGQLVLYDAFAREDFCQWLYQNMSDHRQLPSRHGNYRFESLPDRLNNQDLASIRWITTTQSNTSVVYNHRLIMKAFRKLTAGKNPDFEVPFFLTDQTDFKFVPRMAGYIEYNTAGGELFSIAAMQDFVPNDGDGYTYSLEHLKDYYQQAATTGQVDTRAYQKLARRLGVITGELHNALASNADQPDFAPELITVEDVKGWQTSIVELINRVCDSIRNQLDRHSPQQRQGLQTILDHQQHYVKLVDGLAVLAEAKTYKTRYHGDYHLGQVLKTGDDFVILDFEGEPARSLAERRARHSPLKDEAGMIRSFNYAAYAGLFAAQDATGRTDLEPWATKWESTMVEAFEDGYQEATATNQGAEFLPASAEVKAKVLEVLLLEKAFYELNYEFNNRPDWVPIPLKGLLRIIETKK